LQNNKQRTAQASVYPNILISAVEFNMFFGRRTVRFFDYIINLPDGDEIRRQSFTEEKPPQIIKNNSERRNLFHQSIHLTEK
jgi:hypothetical protein